MNRKKLNFVITGGAGFIGSHLANALLKKNYKILAIDNQRFGNWKNIEKNKNLKIITKDINDIKDFRKYFNKNTVLVHLAAEKHNNSLKYPDKIFKTNCIATNRLFENACAKKVKKIIFSSSLYAYGQISKPVMTEKHSCNPKTVYGITKYSGELLLKKTALENNISYAILRFFFVYGSKQYSGTGYPSVIVKNFKKLKSKKNPLIINDGTQVLDYIHVNDVVDAIIKTSHTKKNLTLNVSSGNSTSIKSLTKKMIEISKIKTKFLYAGRDWTKGTFRVGSNKLIKKELNWSPKISLATGLNEVWDWIKNI